MIPLLRVRILVLVEYEHGIIDAMFVIPVQTVDDVVVSICWGEDELGFQ